MKDNIHRLLEIIEHPDRYTDEELESLMRDPEVSEIYELVCQTKRAIKSEKNLDVDAEWEKFRTKNFKPKYKYNGLYGFIRRNAAIITILIVATIGAVAGSFAIKSLSNSVNSDSETEKINTDESQQSTIVKVSPDVKQDSIVNVTITFKNSSLSEVLNDFSTYYNISKVVFKNDDMSGLKLYFKWDRRKSLEEVVNELNEFQQIDIRIDNNALIVE